MNEPEYRFNMLGEKQRRCPACQFWYLLVEWLRGETNDDCDCAVCDDCWDKQQGPGFRGIGQHIVDSRTLK